VCTTLLRKDFTNLKIDSKNSMKFESRPLIDVLEIPNRQVRQMHADVSAVIVEFSVHLIVM